MYSFVENLNRLLQYTELDRFTRSAHEKQVFTRMQMYTQIYTHTFLFLSVYKLHFVTVVLLQQFCYQTGLDYQARAEFIAGYHHIAVSVS